MVRDSNADLYNTENCRMHICKQNGFADLLILIDLIDNFVMQGVVMLVSSLRQTRHLSSLQRGPTIQQLLPGTDMRNQQIGVHKCCTICQHKNLIEFFICYYFINYWPMMSKPQNKREKGEKSVKASCNEILDEKKDPCLRAFQKKLRNINKKLNQIAELETRKKDLKPEQLDKIDKKQECLKQKEKIEEIIALYQTVLKENQQAIRDTQLAEVAELASVLAAIEYGAEINVKGKSSVKCVSKALLEPSSPNLTLKQRERELHEIFSVISDSQQVKKQANKFIEDNGLATLPSRRQPEQKEESSVSADVDQAPDIESSKSDQAHHTEQAPFTDKTQVKEVKKESKPEPQQKQQVKQGTETQPKVVAVGHEVSETSAQGQNKKQQRDSKRNQKRRKYREEGYQTEEGHPVDHDSRGGDQKAENQMPGHREPGHREPGHREPRDRAPGDRKARNPESRNYEKRPKYRDANQRLRGDERPVRINKKKYQPKEENLRQDSNSSSLSSTPSAREFKKNEKKLLQEEGFTIVGKNKPQKARQQKEFHDKQHGRKHQHHPHQQSNK